MSSVGNPSCFSTMCFGNWMSAELRVVRIRHLHRHVADHRVRRQVFDLLDEVVLIERHLDVAVLRFEREDVAVCGRAACEGGLDDAVRRQPDLSQALGDGTGIRRRLCAAFAPRVFPADDLSGPLVDREGLCAASARRMLTLRAQHVQLHRGRLVVDGDRVGLHLESRPRSARSCMPARRRSWFRCRRTGWSSSSSRPSHRLRQRRRSAGCSRRRRPPAQDRPPGLSWFAWELLFGETRYPRQRVPGRAILQLRWATFA